MCRNLICLFAILFALSINQAVNSAEPIAAPVPSGPATRSVAATNHHSLLTTHQSLALNQYFYIDFPRRLQALQNETQLAEAELALIARRVESYRPFRSFGRYAATYTADQSWQIALLAARQRLECLRNDEADLWRQRRLAAEALAIELANASRQ